jgi:hypothetical protein
VSAAQPAGGPGGGGGRGGGAGRPAAPDAPGAAGASTLAKELRLIRGGAFERVDLLRRMYARATPGPALIRAALFLFSIGALSLTFPVEWLSVTTGLLLAAVAATAALLPRGGATSVVLFVSAGGWTITTGAVPERLTLSRLVAVAGLLYLVHTTAALAAVVPYDTVVQPAVLGRWLARTVAVLVLTTGFAVGAVALVARTGGRTYLVASLVGLGLMAGMVWLLAALRRTR